MFFYSKIRTAKVRVIGILAKSGAGFPTNLLKSPGTNEKGRFWAIGAITL
jgi:hypothetical protein